MQTYNEGAPNRGTLKIPMRWGQGEGLTGVGLEGWARVEVGVNPAKLVLQVVSGSC